MAHDDVDVDVDRKYTSAGRGLYARVM